MSVKMSTVYGSVPFTVWVLLRLKLRGYAEEEWKQGKPGFWKNLTKKRSFIESYVRRYMNEQRHPLITVKETS